MSNPWLKKNPFLSMWLSGANVVASAARGRIAAEAKRQSSAAISKATSDGLGAWPGLNKAATRERKKASFPGVGSSPVAARTNLPPGLQRTKPMAIRRQRSAGSLTVKAAELAVAVPQVVAHRVTRMALAGPKLSARDRKEFQRMIAEKNAAFSESWVAMATQAAVVNQAFAGSMFKSVLSWASGKRPSASASVFQLQRAALDVLGRGVAPVHRKAVANAKRLRRTKLR